MLTSHTFVSVCVTVCVTVRSSFCTRVSVMFALVLVFVFLFGLLFVVVLVLRVNKPVKGWINNELIFLTSEYTNCVFEVNLLYYSWMFPVHRNGSVHPHVYQITKYRKTFCFVSICKKEIVEWMRESLIRVKRYKNCITICALKHTIKHT